ncbi:MAG: NADH-quinone oxidoreductase subunit C [Thermodesulfobacteriota bacterium]
MSLVEETRGKLDRFMGEAAVQPADYTRNGYHLAVTAGPKQIKRLAELLRQEDRFLEFMTAVDRGPNLDLVYMFGSLTEPCRVKALVTVPKDRAVPSLAKVFAAADWFEREAYDLLGARFDGHPNLKRIILPEDADFHPLLKDYQSGESDLNDDFEVGER